MATPDWRGATRDRTRQIRLGGVAIGGGAPVSVQTMTNSDTRDVVATVRQIREAAEAGADIVRVAVLDTDAAVALRAIRRQVQVPLVADIHFDYRLALSAVDAGVDGLRINPGNIGGAEQVRAVVDAARPRKIPIRIGVNSGSLERDILERHGAPTAAALVESALRHVALLEVAGYQEIKISVKASDVPRTLAAYRLLAEQTAYPLHVGVTEAGTFLAGTVRSCVAMGTLLLEGLGDTIRVSLTDTPLNEVKVGVEMLRAAGLRAAGASVTSCPTCGRTQVDVVAVATAVERELERHYREQPDAPRPHVAIMGCLVNGPGEARGADIAVAGGNGKFALYVRGEQVAVIPEQDAVRRVVEQVKGWPGLPVCLDVAARVWHNRAHEKVPPDTGCEGQAV